MLDEWVEQPHTPSWEIVHHDESYGGTEAPLFILEHRADFLSQYVYLFRSGLINLLLFLLSTTLSLKLSVCRLLDSIQDEREGKRKRNDGGKVESIPLTSDSDESI